MKSKYICTDCTREIPWSEYQQQSDIFCSECGGHIEEVIENSMLERKQYLESLYTTLLKKNLANTDVDQEDAKLCSRIIEERKNQFKKTETFSEKPSQNSLLILCESCSHKFSKRANECPKCGWKILATCQICQQKIPFDSTVCPECGDPSPFTGEHIKEQKTNDQTALTSYYSNQKSVHPVTTANTRPSNFSLSWFLFSFDGRIGRKLFWCVYPVIFFLGLILSVAIELVKESRNMNGLIIIGILTLLLLWPSLAVQVKRWHDRNKSGNWVILNLIPILGFIWVVIELGFLKGTEDSNDYGNDPLSN